MSFAISTACHNRRLLGYAGALLALTLLVAQWLLLLHESEVTTHVDEVPCEVCLALQVVGDSLPLSGGHQATVPAADKPRQTDAEVYRSCRLAVFRARGPPIVFS